VITFPHQLSVSSAFASSLPPQDRPTLGWRAGGLVERSPELTRQVLHPAMHEKLLLRAAELVTMGWTRGTAARDADGQELRSTLPRATAWCVFAEKGTSGRLVRQPDNSRQRAPQSQATVEGAGGTNTPPAGPSGVCAASAARPGRSRDSVQAVVLPGRHSAARYLADDANGWSGGVSILISMAHLPR
jgi:hypothetical protein